MSGFQRTIREAVLSALPEIKVKDAGDAPEADRSLRPNNRHISTPRSETGYHTKDASAIEATRLCAAQGIKPAQQRTLKVSPVVHWSEHNATPAVHWSEHDTKQGTSASSSSLRAKYDGCIAKAIVQKTSASRGKVLNSPARSRSRNRNGKYSDSTAYRNHVLKKEAVENGKIAQPRPQPIVVVDLEPAEPPRAGRKADQFIQAESGIASSSKVGLGVTMRRYHGIVKHSALSDAAFPIQITLESDCRGEWTALDSTEQIRVVREGTHVRMLDSTTELNGEESSSGVIRGVVIHCGDQDGEFELKPEAAEEIGEQDDPEPSPTMDMKRESAQTNPLQEAKEEDVELEADSEEKAFSSEAPENEDAFFSHIAWFLDLSNRSISTVAHKDSEKLAWIFSQSSGTLELWLRCEDPHTATLLEMSSNIHADCLSCCSTGDIQIDDFVKVEKALLETPAWSSAFIGMRASILEGSLGGLSAVATGKNTKFRQRGARLALAVSAAVLQPELSRSWGDEFQALVALASHTKLGSDDDVNPAFATSSHGNIFSDSDANFKQEGNARCLDTHRAAGTAPNDCEDNIKYEGRMDTCEKKSRVSGFIETTKEPALNNSPGRDNEHARSAGVASVVDFKQKDDHAFSDVEQSDDGPEFADVKQNDDHEFSEVEQSDDSNELTDVKQNDEHELIDVKHNDEHELPSEVSPVGSCQDGLEVKREASDTRPDDSHLVRTSNNSKWCQRCRNHRSTHLRECRGCGKLVGYNCEPEQCWDKDWLLCKACVASRQRELVDDAAQAGEPNPSPTPYCNLSASGSQSGSSSEGASVSQLGTPIASGEVKQNDDCRELKEVKHNDDSRGLTCVTQNDDYEWTDVKQNDDYEWTDVKQNDDYEWTDVKQNNDCEWTDVKQNDDHELADIRTNGDNETIAERSSLSSPDDNSTCLAGKSLELCGNTIQSMPAEQRLFPRCASFCCDWLLKGRCWSRNCIYLHKVSDSTPSSAIGSSFNKEDEFKQVANQILKNLSEPLEDRRCFVLDGKKGATITSLARQTNEVMSPNIDTGVVSALKDQCVSVCCTSSAALSIAGQHKVQFGCIYLDYMWPLDYFEKLSSILKKSVQMLPKTRDGKDRAAAIHELLASNIVESDGFRDVERLISEPDALSTQNLPRPTAVAPSKRASRIVSGVLNLGNIDFKDTPGCANESCTLKEEESLKKTSELLGLEMEALKKCITERKITIGKDTTVSPLRCDQARAARDSLAKLLYGRLFLWLIGHMNTLFAMQDGDESPGGWHSEMMSNERLLGVLDIAGFESFEKNSLEQLLINLSNEHLHQTFNEFVFKAEVAESQKEGIPVPSAIDFTDNADVLAFIDGRGGCLDLLDETMLVPKCTDIDFVSKLLKQHEKNPIVVPQKFAKDKFEIKHFAGQVLYSSDGWLDKNSDAPPGDAPIMLAESSLEVLQTFGNDIQSEAAAVETGNRQTAGSKAPMKRKAKSVCSVFRTSLKALMVKISHADPHYVLCMKPNMQKVPKKFNAAAVMEQLLLTGVLAAVQIRQQGFAYRIIHDEFAFDYRCIVDMAQSGKSKASKAAGREDIQKLVEALPDALEKLGFVGIAMSDFAVGITKVFFKFAAYKTLHDARRYALFKSATKTQSAFRGYVARKLITERKEIRGRIRECLAPLSLGTLCLPGADQRGSSATWPAQESLLERLKDNFDKKGGELIDRIELVLHEAMEADFRCPDVVQAERIFNRLQLELEVAEEVNSALKSIDPMEVEKALSRATSVSLPPRERIAGLEQRIKTLRAQLPLKKALETALAAGHTADSVTDEQLLELQDIVEEVAAAGIVSGGSTGGGEERRLSDDYEAYTYAQFLEKFGQDEGKAAWEKAQPEQAWMPELGAAELWKSLLDIITAIEEKKRREMETAAEAELRIAREKEEEAKAAIKAAEDKKAAEEAAAKAAEEAEEAKRKAEEAAKPRKSILKGGNMLQVPGEDDGDLPQFGERKRREGRSRTVTGLAVAGQVKIITSLKKAVDEYDIEAIEELLRKATENGIKDDFAVDDFSLANARETFQQLQGEDFLKAEIERARKEAIQPATPVMALSRLEHLAKQLGQMPGHEEEAQEASQFAQKALVSYSKAKRDDKTVFDSEDQSEVDLAEKIFGDLSTFARLKPAQAWKARLRGNGGRPSVCAWRASTWVGRRSMTSRRGTARLGGGQEEQPEGIMIHGKVIVESLTRTPDGYDEKEYDAAATQNFRNILVAMGDRAAQECQRKASIDAVVMLAREAEHLRDEVFMQVLKQLIKNPNPRSVGLGWELLYQLCQEAKPTDDIIEFVRTFITKGMKEMDFSGVSYFFTLRLSRLLGCRQDMSDKADA